MPCCRTKNQVKNVFHEGKITGSKVDERSERQRRMIWKAESDMHKERIQMQARASFLQR